MDWLGVMGGVFIGFAVGSVLEHHKMLPGWYWGDW